MFLVLILSSFFTFVELNCENLFDTIMILSRMIGSSCQRVIIIGRGLDIGES